MKLNNKHHLFQDLRNSSDPDSMNRQTQRQACQRQARGREYSQHAVVTSSVFLMLQKYALLHTCVPDRKINSRMGQTEIKILNF